MEFNLFMNEDGEMELLNTEIQVESVMSDDVVIDWLMRMEQDDAAAELADETLMQPVRRAG